MDILLIRKRREVKHKDNKKTGRKQMEFFRYIVNVKTE